MTVELPDHVTAAGTKVSAVWFGAIYGGFTDFPIAKLVLWVTLIYSSLQTYKVARDLWREWRAKKEASAKFAADILEREAPK